MLDDTTRTYGEELGEEARANQSAYAQLRAFIHAEVAGAESIDLPALVERAEEQFTAEFFARLARERLRSIIYGMISPFSRPATCLSKTPPPGKRTAQKMEGVFAGWHEYIRDGHKVSLLGMTREDVTAAKMHRRDAAARETAIARFFGALEKRLKPGQIVRDVISIDDLTHLAEEHGVLTADKAVEK